MRTKTKTLSIKPATVPQQQTPAMSPAKGQSTSQAASRGEFRDAIPAWFELRTRLAKLENDYTRMCLHGLIRALEAGHGSGTPAAEFILDLAVNHGLGRMLTPDKADEAAADFRRSFECSKKEAIIFLRAYPEFVGEVSPSA